ncbi:MAG: hypothetical protein KDB27_01170 [Planctomycetales bacterium]|nr:hypothetical protein [Planctomycetales bacterium]
MRPRSLQFDRPIPIRLRPDLQFCERDAIDPHVAVKDPVSLNYFLLRQEEFAILQCLDGTSSIGEIQKQYERQFGPRTISSPEILGLIRNAHRDGLLVVDSPNQAAILLGRLRKKRSLDCVSQILNPLVIRWRGFNPNRVLEKITPTFCGLFQPAALVACFLLCVIACGLVFSQLPRLQNQIEFHHVFAAQNIVLMVIVLIVVKLLHEFGHAITCKHFGGEVHELGSIFVAGVPLLYCNVSDSWMFPKRSQRVAVSAAGIVVELVCASLAAIAWSFSSPGTFNAICLNVMLVGSINSVLTNGNPLLRFDGYFILSDVIGVPNLWSRSRSIVYDWLCRSAFGVSPYNRRALSESGRLWIAAYAIASMIYRVAILFVLFVIAEYLFSYYDVPVLFPVVVVLSMCGLLIGPLFAFYRLWSNTMFRRQVNRFRLSFSSIAIAAVMCVIAFVPLPMRVRTLATIEARSAESIYVTAPGVLIETVAAGDKVTLGDPIARLQNTSMEFERHQLQSEFDVQRAHVRALTAIESSDEHARASLPAAREELTRLQSLLASLKVDLDRLVLRSPANGVVLPKYSEELIWDSEDNLRLEKWTDIPLAKENVGCYLETGTECCRVGDPNSIEALITLDERQLRFVSEGQAVTIRVPGFSESFRGLVASVARRGTVRDALELAREGKIDADRPTKVLYEARVTVESSANTVVPVIGTTGRATVTVSPHTLVQRIVWYFRDTFTRNSEVT